jgi:peptidyl-prolyl cis-trans isomerase B (cyclophilin B)
MQSILRTKPTSLIVAAALVSLFIRCGEASETPMKSVAEPAASSSIPNGKNEESTAAEVPKLPPPLDDKTCVPFLTNFGAQNSTSQVKMTTKWGEVIIKLYDDVPLHRANFLYLIERSYFSPSQIVRIVPDFVIQGGTSEEVDDQRKRAIIGDHTLPNEFLPHRIHKRGALAMSRSYTENPNKRSSGYDFYIVIGKPVNGATLHTTSMENGMNYTEEQKRIYATKGGTPHLDNEHTVFGEVVSGMEAVESISRLERDGSDWPVQHVEFTIEAVK